MEVKCKPRGRRWPAGCSRAPRPRPRCGHSARPGRAPRARPRAGAGGAAPHCAGSAASPRCAHAPGPGRSDGPQRGPRPACSARAAPAPRTRPAPLAYTLSIHRLGLCPVRGKLPSFPRPVTWYTAPGYAMQSGRAMRAHLPSGVWPCQYNRPDPVFTRPPQHRKHLGVKSDS